MTERVSISRSKFKDVFLGIVPFKSLDKWERVMYAIYVWGITDGREITILESVSLLDPELSDTLTDRFIGSHITDLVEKANEMSVAEGAAI